MNISLITISARFTSRLKSIAEQNSEQLMLSKLSKLDAEIAEVQLETENPQITRLIRRMLKDIRNLEMGIEQVGYRKYLEDHKKVMTKYGEERDYGFTPEFEEERELPLQLAEMNDLEIWVRIKVNEDGEYVMLGFGFEDKHYKVHWIDWSMIQTVMPTIAIINMTNQVRIHAQEDPAVDPQKEE